MSTKSLASPPRRPRNFATIGNPASTPRKRHPYELQTLAGATLAGHDEPGPLCRRLEDKRDCVVVRVKDNTVVASSPRSDAKESA